jgi:hypothetical protein
MSALFPAPTHQSGVRWTDLPTPLDSAFPSCYLSYKQSAFLPLLCFHNLTNPFSRKPFSLITIRIAGGVPLQVPVSFHKSHHCNSQAASFQQLAASFSLLALFFKLVSFVFRDLQPLLAKHRGWGRGVAFSRHSSLVYPERSRGATRHFIALLGSRSNA